jgi:hypothetical protein
MTTHPRRYGRRPAQPGRKSLHFKACLRPEQPAPPASADWLSPVPEGTFGMLGNDQWGDCTCAGVAHKRIGDVYINQGGKVLSVTTTQTLALYSAITGFNPNDPSTDQGAVCQDVLDYWRKHGFLGEKIVAFAKVDLSNLDEVKTAIAELGQIYCGFNVPQSAEDQFNDGQEWTVVKHSRLIGGHCVTVGAYDKDGLECVTWGTVQRMTWQFFQTYFDEAWVIVTPDMIDPATGKDIAGFDLYALGQDFAAVTGETNPVPQPKPTPTPVPTGPTAADKALAAAFDTWRAATGA